jgi:hypothetical protein
MNEIGSLSVAPAVAAVILPSQPSEKLGLQRLHLIYNLYFYSFGYQYIDTFI